LLETSGKISKERKIVLSEEQKKNKRRRMIIRRIRAVVGNTALIIERGRGNTLV
jgi:hypothetical protein